MPSISPTVNLVVLKAPDIELAASFYKLLGISMEKHQHGSGPMHYCADLKGIIFEIYPGKVEVNSPSTTRLGFQVQHLSSTLDNLRSHGVKVLQDKAQSPWGLRAVVEDLTGVRIELLEKSEAFQAAHS